MIFLVLMTFLAVVQNYFKMSGFIYLTGGISFLVFLFIPIALALITVLVISRFFPIVQAKGILVVIGLLTGSSIIAGIRFMQPENLSSTEGKLRLVTFIQSLHKPWMTWLPSEWVTNLIFAQSQKDLPGSRQTFRSSWGRRRCWRFCYMYWRSGIT